MNSVAQPDAATLSQQLADYICDERLERIDAAAVTRTKQIIASHIGLAFRGIREGCLDALHGVAVARGLSGGAGSVSIIGHREKATLADAVLANCALMRSPDQGDVVFPAGVHPGLIAVPIALGLAEQLRCSGGEMIAAIVASYEIMGKLGRWTSSGKWRRSILPLAALGAVTAAGRLLRLSRAEMAVAIDYGGMTAMELAEGGSPAGPITHYYGLVCRTGLTNAYIARSGGACAPLGLDAPAGFLESYCGSSAFDRSTLTLGRNYEVLTAYEKRYPGAALNQVAIERMRGFIADQGLRAADVARIAITLPLDRKTRDAGYFLGPFTTRKQATSSMAFQLAILLLGAEANPSRFNDVGDPAVQALADLTEVDSAPGKSLRYVRLEVLTKDGRRLTAEGDDFRYPPEPFRPMLEREADGLLPQTNIARLAELLDNLESLEDASEPVGRLAL